MVKVHIYPSETEKILKLKPYHGIGDIFRCYSQYRLMRFLENKYKFKSVVEVPYDHSTMGIDHNIFRCKHTSYKNFNQLSNESFDLVYNFSFLQRNPNLIFKLIRVSKQYILAFVPNVLNPGAIPHKLYHIIYKTTCDHPERGDPALMTLNGLKGLFREANIKVLEEGYIDVPPWPDTVVTLAEMFGIRSRTYLKLPFPKILLYFERIGMIFGKVLAHHIYVFGEKNSPDISYADHSRAKMEKNDQ